MADPASEAAGGGPVFPGGSGARLDSWKAVAEYLGRHVTTVQRWEHEEGLPIRRHQHEKRGSVYAYPAELDAWLAARCGGTPPIDAAPAEGVIPERGPVTPSAPSNAGPQPVASQARLDGPQSHDAPLLGDWPSGAAVRFASPPALRKSSFAWIAVAALLGLTIAVVIADTVWSPVGVKNETVSVAVLPLENRSPDQQLDYFVDGMTEALMTDLASLSPVRVIARQSVMQFRNSGKAASAIAAELKADALVEGAVQRSGQRIRVDIRLIDGSTSRSLWASTYERDLGDALVLQSEISRAITSELHLTLDPLQRERLARRRPANPEAWDAYLRARFFWNRRTHEDMSRAVEWYERAIDRDPSFALAWAGLADVYATLGPPNVSPADLIARGTAAADKAIQLDPLLGEPLAALGKLRAYAWDWQGAEDNYRAAIKRAPGYAPARYWLGSFLANQGRCEEALAAAREAERLDPVSLPGNLVVAGIERRCNRLEEAIRRNRMILEFDPQFGPSYESLGRAYMAQGKVQDAIGFLQKAVELTGERATVLASLGYAYALEGRTAAAEAIAADLATRHQRGKALASAWSVAIVYAGLRRNDSALTWLEHAYDDREEWLEALASDERFARLHMNDRFRQLLYRLGLPGAASSAMTRWLPSR